MTQSSRPTIGASVMVYDHDNMWHATPAKIIAVINQGIHGWIVELDNLRMVEVRVMGNGYDFRELSTEERRGEHQRHSTRSVGE